MASITFDSPDDALAQPQVFEAIRRGILTITDRQIKYSLARDGPTTGPRPEEWVRAFTLAWLIVDKGYPANRIKTEVSVPRRTPSDYADIVVYAGDDIREPYLVIENKSSGQTKAQRLQWIEQCFGNANSLRAPLALYDDGEISILFNVADYPSTGREEIGSATEMCCRRSTVTFRSLLMLPVRSATLSRYLLPRLKPEFAEPTH